MRKRAGVVMINPETEEILLIGRKKGNQDIYYVIPGGGVEENETYLEGARREMLEELNLKPGDMHYFFSKDKEVYYYSLTMEKKGIYYSWRRERSPKQRESVYSNLGENKRYGKYEYFPW